MADTITTIVLFEVPAAQAERFEADWHESNAFMARQPGLIEGTLYRAVTGAAPYRFVNVARWESEAALAAARKAHAETLAAQGRDQRREWAALGIKPLPTTYVEVTSY